MSDSMFGYYFGLAVRSLKRNTVLTALMVAAIGVGIGASMTMLTVFRAMAGDPIPHKSRQLFVPQIDNWGPVGRVFDSPDKLEDQISYIDAMALMSAHAAPHQTAAYALGFAVTPSDPQLLPFKVQARATYSDFFAMFEVPFQYGAAWSASEDQARAPVVVISRELNDKLFAGANSVGRTVNLDNENYRVIGVLQHWQPAPRFYDLSTSPFGESEQVYVPFTRAIDRQINTWGNMNCAKRSDPGWQGLLDSNCIWIQFWVELPSAAAAQNYRRWLNNYAAEQQRSGRFSWPARTQLRDLRTWLKYRHVVSDEARIMMLVSFSFLFVCVLNAMGLMLAKFMGRAADIGVRRALGANRRAILAQCLIEAAVVGVAGGVLGVALTALGLLGLRGVLSRQALELTHMDVTGVGIAMVMAIAATIIAALYPTWRAADIQPAW
jgi:putative ABC transport system permease protein